MAWATTSLAAGLAGQAVQNGGRSRHGTAIDHVADGVARGGRHRPPPNALVQQPTALIEVGAEQRVTSRTGVDRDSRWARWTRGGNTSRVALFPPGVPPPVPQ